MMSWRMMWGLAILGLAIAPALTLPGAAFAAGSGGSCASDGRCSARTPTCSRQTTSGVNNCGNTCYKYFSNTCSAPTPSCQNLTTTGTWTCGGSCTKTFNNSCTASAPACGQTTTGTYVCGGSCTKTGGACSTKVPYGYAVPGDPKYGYGLPDNNTKTLLALAAKGNVILGDYTSPDFNTNVLPKLGTGANSITQPYAIDPTDEKLGYHDDGFTTGNLPRFSGNYDQWDNGYKLDAAGNPTDKKRKFYESSLTDNRFRALLDPNWKPSTNPTNGQIDAVIFTNHLLAGWAPHRDTFYQFGSMVARDDAMMFKNGFWSDHDARLSGAGATGGASGSALVGIGLPLSVGRPRLQRWQECPPAACPP